MVPKDLLDALLSVENDDDLEAVYLQFTDEQRREVMRLMETRSVQAGVIAAYFEYRLASSVEWSRDMIVRRRRRIKQALGYAPGA